MQKKLKVDRRKQKMENELEVRKRRGTDNKGITLVALVITKLVPTA